MGEETETISKKAAAVDYYNFNAKITHICFASIFAVFLTAGISVLGEWLGALVAGISSAFYAWFIFKHKSEMTRLDVTYTLGMKKKQEEKETIIKESLKNLGGAISK